MDGWRGKRQAVLAGYSGSSYQTAPINYYDYNQPMILAPPTATSRGPVTCNEASLPVHRKWHSLIYRPFAERGLFMVKTGYWIHSAREERERERPS